MSVCSFLAMVFMSFRSNCAISGTSGSFGLGSVNREEMESSTLRQAQQGGRTKGDGSLHSFEMFAFSNLEFARGKQASRLAPFAHLKSPGFSIPIFALGGPLYI